MSKQKTKRKLLSEDEKLNRKKKYNKKYNKKYASVRRKRYKENAEERQLRRDQSRLSYRKNNGLLSNEYAQHLDEVVKDLSSHGTKRSVTNSEGLVSIRVCFTIDELATILKKSPKTVRFWISTKKLPMHTYTIQGKGNTGVYVLPQVKSFCNILSSLGSEGCNLTSSMKGIIEALNQVT